MSPAGRRIFVAVPLDETLRDALSDLERRLEAAGARARWVRPETLHFTLRFLGHISDTELRRVQVATRGAADGIEPFAITLAGLGAFPSPQRPQVIWIGVREGADRLSALARRLEDALARQRFANEPRGFHPHLTLARLKEAGLWSAVDRVLTEFEGVEVGSMRVEALVVMESLLRPQGPIYTPVEEVPLHHHEK